MINMLEQTANKPTTTAAIFITFFIANPTTAPNRNPPPAENTNSSICNSEEMPLMSS